ncbi:hypothetical protein [Neisseria weaveri]|uniref:Membrane protein n=1 Tax=Neisseria weaveri TaxID=28091 RepID=A0A448VQX5_9NEIS|nr:hypothetical protein [Neisseria weaveri]EGV37994.1 putative membrane protein [Neisseria weaveri LMG 5135]VEJ52171.1 Membrane protein [Neisseria weaveri]
MPQKNLLPHWLIICLIPLITLLLIKLTGPHDDTQYLINGIILACEAAFLFKYVLFKAVKHHLKSEDSLQRHTLFLFIPIILLVAYLFRYFGAF